MSDSDRDKPVYTHPWFIGLDIAGDYLVWLDFTAKSTALEDIERDSLRESIQEMWGW